MSEIKMVRPMKGENIVTEIENDPDSLRATIRGCLRELDEERLALEQVCDDLREEAMTDGDVQHPAWLRRAIALRRLLPGKDGDGE